MSTRGDTRQSAGNAVIPGGGGDKSISAKEGISEMARILVQTDNQRTVLLDEREVRPEHLNDRHSAAQLLERLEWAIRDAESRRVGPAPRRRAPRLPIKAFETARGRAFD